MNFYESQDVAKRNTGKLIFLFALAVVSLIVITNVLVMLLMGYVSIDTQAVTSGYINFDWSTFLAVSGAVIVLIALGSLIKIGALAGGGARVAEMMNGRLIMADGQDPMERRVINVVEEMAIASGTPVPPVYLMEESGINAFAAGYTPSDAVIGITRGAIENLSREQLQGVIAHEFSHILHGDMRINIRLIGVLYGIMVLGIVGHFMMRGSFYSRRKEANGLVFLGLGLVVVGFVGTFFGNMIKAAVSRQREFLADASAVQYTRNPQGIGGALMRIATHVERSYLNNPSSAEISHALFEEPTISATKNIYATHPPLADRIRAILPDWDGNFEQPAPLRDDADSGASEAASAASTGKQKMEAMMGSALGVLVTDAMISSVGNPDKAHLKYANTLLRNLPQELLQAAHNPATARALIYFLVLDRDTEMRDLQLNFLDSNADTGVYAELKKLMANNVTVATEQRLTLVNLALPQLRQLSSEQYMLFRGNFGKLIEIDKKISLFEWSLQKIVCLHLDRVFDEKARTNFGRDELLSRKAECQLLLSMLSHASDQQGLSAEQAFNLGVEKLHLGEMQLLPQQAISFTGLNKALDKLAALKPLQKPLLLKACAACIVADKKIEAGEVELFRAIADTLDCPMPPLLIEDNNE